MSNSESNAQFKTIIDAMKSILQVVIFVVIFTLSDCETLCGIKEPPLRKLIVNGWPASAWPWHGAIFYKKIKASWMYVCGASIITENFVITSAHCTFTPDGPMKKRRMLVKVGLTKLDDSGESVQVLQVAKIIRHKNYSPGHNDVALLRVSKNITFVELRVQPICLWNGDSNFDHIVHSVGILTGWGGYDEIRTVNELQEITIPIVSNQICRTTYQYVADFVIDSSKFCGGHANGSLSTDGDSGGGLFLKVGKIWFLRGILSMGPNRPDGYDVFMDVAYFQKWLAKRIPEFRTIFPVVKARNQCGFRRSVSIYNESISLGWPWHGAMFHRLKNSELSYACGVTILTEFYVVSAAHCTLSSNSVELRAINIFVKVGLSRLNATDHVQLLAVQEVKRHEFYAPHKHEDDIVLLKLKSKILFNDHHVRPICLWNGKVWLKNVVNQTGYIAGWGRNEKGDISNQLQEASMPIVSRRTCIESDPKHFDLFYRDPKTFCAGNKNGTNASAGDSGGGLYLKIGDQWFLRGIVNNIKFHNQSTTDVNSYLLLHDIGFYQFWIRENVPSDQFPPQ